MMGKKAGDGGLNRMFSNYWGNVSDPIENKVIADGFTFTYRQTITVPAGASNIFFNPVACAATKFVSVFPPQFIAIGASKININYYIGATYTGGTPVLGANRNQLSPITAGSFIISDGTLATPGTLAPVSWLIAANAQGNIVTPGISGGALPFVLNPVFIQRLAIDNTDALSADLELNFTWNEIPFTALP